jgi:transposase
MAKKGQKYKKYSPEFKISVIMDMREHGLSYNATMRKYFPDSPTKNYYFLKQWERIYLTEGATGFMVKRRGRGSKGRPRKKPLPPEAECDLLDEVQRLRERNEYLEMENEYLKKLDALIRAEEQEKNKKQ